MKNKIFLAISLLAAIFAVTSCLKDDVGEDWTDSLKGKMYAEVWNGGFKAFGMQPTTDTVTFKFLVNIASDQPPTENITLTLGVYPAAITRYNTLKNTTYKLYPSIKIQNPTVVIESGTRNAYVYVDVWGADTLSACDNFMAPITILTATGGVIPADPVNVGSRLMALPIANKYQGDYHAYGYFKHPTPSSSRFIDMDKTYGTLTCKSIHGDLADLGPDYTFDLIVNEDSVMVVGGHNVNPVTIVGYGAQVTEQIDLGDDLITLATGVVFNYWDPTTKQFVLRYHYNNGAAWREVMETLTKL